MNTPKIVKKEFIGQEEILLSEHKGFYLIECFGNNTGSSDTYYSDVAYTKNESELLFKDFCESAWSRLARNAG